MHNYVFNGDADGLCALQQLRLAGPRAAAQGEQGEQGEKEALITGVKRDIALLDRVRSVAGDTCTVLDVSLDVNRAGLVALLAGGVSVRYFDHHFAGDIPAHPALDAHIDLSPNVCTSLIVDRTLEGRFRRWAIVGAYGDSMTAEADALAREMGIAPDAAERLKALGIAINYNAYGETVEDLHVPPVELAAEMLPFADPLQFADGSAACKRLADGMRDDMELAKRLRPAREAPGAVVFMLPDAAWARRASGTLANDKAKAHGGSAVAIVSPKTEGGFLVSVRVPKHFSVSAEAFCRRFPTGGGRKTAAGINHLPNEELESFTSAFEQQFRAETSA